MPNPSRPEDTRQLHILLPVADAARLAAHAVLLGETRTDIAARAVKELLDRETSPPQRAAS